MSAYYNEFDPYAAAWLRNLIAAGHIPAGDVDERSIVDVQPADLAGYTQCHFFAGIGGWAHALRLAGWDDDRPAWTGSCPCQPFSAAGQRKGTADARHLWPEFERLIAELLPPTVFGEQVASKDGRVWLAGIRTDLENVGYAVGALDLCAAGVGAPHIRQRLFWVADAENANGGSREREAQAGVGQDGERGRGFGERGLAGGLEHAESDGREQRRAEPGGRGLTSGCGESFWSAADWLPCTDGKARRVEPGTFPLAHGVSNRVGRLRAYGNAIVPQAAAEFIKAWSE